METQTMATIFSLLSRAAIVTLAMTPALALASETQCPAMQGGTKLMTATLFDGPLSENASLTPDTFHEDKAQGRSEWDVAYIFKAGRQLFVECRYGPKISVVLKPGPSTYKCEWLSQATERHSLTCKAR